MLNKTSSHNRLDDKSYHLRVILTVCIHNA
uniref:Uncharacterized protein n=1 Tax=Klebsiella phage vB_KpnM_Iguana_ER37 TaxID=3076781 RepID=A0AB38Z3P2_9CAUD